MDFAKVTTEVYIFHQTVYRAVGMHIFLEPDASPFIDNQLPY